MNEADLLNGMADIELPAPPDWSPVIIGIIVAALIILFIGLITWRTIKANKKLGDTAIVSIEHSQLLLDQLQDKWQQGRISDREATYQLSTLLRLGLGLPQLTPRCPASLKPDTAAWEETIRIFNRLRYKKTPRTRLTPDIFTNTKKWLTSTAGNHQQPCGHLLHHCGYLPCRYPGCYGC